MKSAAHASYAKGLIVFCSPLACNTISKKSVIYPSAFKVPQNLHYAFGTIPHTVTYVCSHPRHHLLIELSILCIVTWVCLSVSRCLSASLYVLAHYSQPPLFVSYFVLHPSRCYRMSSDDLGELLWLLWPCGTGVPNGIAARIVRWHHSFFTGGCQSNLPEFRLFHSLVRIQNSLFCKYVGPFICRFSSMCFHFLQKSGCSSCSPLSKHPRWMPPSTLPFHVHQSTCWLLFVNTSCHTIPLSLCREVPVKMLSIQARRHVQTLADLAHFSCANTCVVIQAWGVGTACELTFAARDSWL